MNPIEFVDRYVSVVDSIASEASKEPNKFFQIKDIIQATINEVKDVTDHQLYHEITRTKNIFNFGKRIEGKIKFNAFEFAFLVELIKRRKSSVAQSARHEQGSN